MINERLMKEFVSVCLSILLFFGGRGDIYVLLKRANRMCVEYNFEKRQEIRGNKFFRDPAAVKLLADELEKGGFVYNNDKDTIVICLEYVDYLVSSSVSLYGDTTYFSLPSQIHAYSSRGESHLVLNESFAYVNDVRHEDGPYGQRDPIPDILRGEKRKLMMDIYTKYGDFAFGASPGNHIRIALKNGRIESVTNWIFLLNYNYWNDL